jgi:succinate-semialdehyde dehydrogenase/glutarate-semialdehyde dehydrogenase
MTATHAPGLPIVEDGLLVSTNPATGEEVARVPIAGPEDVAAAVDRARTAAAWWTGLGFAGRRTRLLQFRSVLASRMPEIADLLRRECGKPMIEGVTETAGVIPHVAWAARNARRVLGPRRVRASTVALEYSARMEYQPLGVIGAIGPWNYPAGAISALAAYVLAAGNAMVYKPSEYTPGVSQWLADRFAEVVPEHPVLQVVHGLGDTGAALCRAGVDKIAFIGSTATAKKVMATCAETLTPILAEGGGKDAMIVAADADLDAAADAALGGGLCNAGQTCTGIERVYVASTVADEFIDRLVTGARKLKVGVDNHASLGPIIMPAQVDTIRRHIADGLARGGTAPLGGVDAVQPPYVQPTILVDVPEDSTAVREETFGPVLVVNRVRDADEGITRANALPVRTRRIRVRQAPRAGTGPPHAIWHDRGELGAVLCRHAEPALRRRRRLRVRAHERRRWAARVRPVKGNHSAPGAVAAADLDVRARPGRDRAACRGRRPAATRPLSAAAAAKRGRASPPLSTE